jgi:hypothetical protein
VCKLPVKQTLEITCIGLLCVSVLATKTVAQQTFVVDSSDACLIAAPTKGLTTQSDVVKFCRSMSDKQLAQTGALAAVYAEAMPLIIAAARQAELSICGSNLCAAHLPTRLMVVAQGIPTVQRELLPDALEIAISSGMIDYAMRPAQYYMRDVVHHRVKPSAHPELLSFIDSISKAEGLDCDTRVSWLADPTYEPDSIERKAVFLATFSSLEFVFAHEYAHSYFGEDCNSHSTVREDIEAACDSIAFVRSLRSKSIEPGSVIAAFLTLSHWESLRRPRIESFNQIPLPDRGVPSQNKPMAGRNWQQRILVMHHLWTGTCGVWGSSVAFCDNNDEATAYLMTLLKRSRPKACIETHKVSVNTRPDFNGLLQSQARIE